MNSFVLMHIGLCLLSGNVPNGSTICCMYVTCAGEGFTHPPSRQLGSHPYSLPSLKNKATSPPVALPQTKGFQGPKSPTVKPLCMTLT